ncbi:MAG: AbrB/MazE/SpoVT family DNA-binding domain-containing protein [Wenzhouxiangellaceae bacterium]
MLKSGLRGSIQVGGAMATLTEKGQVVIPAHIRRRYGLTPGTTVGNTPCSPRKNHSPGFQLRKFMQRWGELGALRPLSADGQL